MEVSKPIACSPVQLEMLGVLQYSYCKLALLGDRFQAVHVRPVWIMLFFQPIMLCSYPFQISLYMLRGFTHYAPTLNKKMHF